MGLHGIFKLRKLYSHSHVFGHVICVWCVIDYVIIGRLHYEHVTARDLGVYYIRFSNLREWLMKALGPPRRAGPRTLGD